WERKRSSGSRSRGWLRRLPPPCCTPGTCERRRARSEPEARPPCLPSSCCSSPSSPSLPALPRTALDA
ncbi:MAG: hypothetical protein AVDCRST_MAG19-399, partial [uncultured Thermomicrobiales bacterium]